jgi:hypothetical protein
MLNLVVRRETARLLKVNISKFYSGRNYEQTEVRECLLSFDAESFCLPVCYPKIERLRYTES